jgi:exodeoxyribonuclease VII small subunit
MSRADADTTTELTFEKALTSLQETVERLESGDLSLDATIDDFRHATELASLCQRMIAEAELRITELAETGEQAQPTADRFTQAPF